MTIPVFVSNGSAVATVTTTLSLVAPSLIAGDCLVANIATNDNTAPSGFDARWITVGSNPSGASLQHSVYILPNCAAGDSGATFNFTVAGTTVAFGQLSLYRGAAAAQLASPNRAVSANTSSATVTWTTMTVKAGESLTIAAFGYAKNGASDGGISAGTPSFTNRYLSNTATGNTEAIGLYDGVAPSGTATGTRTMATGAVAAVNVGTMFELLGAGGDGGASMPGSGPVNFPAVIRQRADGRLVDAPKPY